MSEIDPAWFYSSLAQTSAAIVGLMGALLGSRIIDHVGFMRAERKEIDQEILSVHHAIRGRVTRLQNLKEYLQREIDEDRATLKRRHSKRKINVWLSWSESGNSTIPKEINVKENLLRSEKDVVAIDLMMPAYIPLDGRIQDTFLLDYIKRLRNVAEDVHEEPRKWLLADANKIERLYQQIALFRVKSAPRSFLIVLLLLIWLSFTGILWPLFTLPGFPNDYSKLIMWTSFAIGLLGLLGYYGYQMVEANRLGRLRWPPST